MRPERNNNGQKNLSKRLNVLRAGVLGANDGIISVAGVVIGVAASGQGNGIIALSGFAAFMAGAFSMAGGEYVSVSTQLDTERVVAREAGAEGIEFTNPWQAAAASFFSFAVGAFLPLIFALVFPINLKIVAIVIAVIVSLFFTGFISAKLGNAPIVPAVRRNLTVGILTMVVTFAIGRILQVN